MNLNQKIAIFILIITTLFGYLLVLNKYQPEINKDDPKNIAKNYIPNAVIEILNNTAFNKTASYGNGTRGNPWIIENLVINVGNGTYSMYIYDTTDYFILRNCTFHEGLKI
jgi:hypothetical protein